MGLFFFFNDTATTEIYTLSLHDALPISQGDMAHAEPLLQRALAIREAALGNNHPDVAETLNSLAVLHAQRSEEHTSELQSRQYLVCRLLLEKKKDTKSSSYFVVVSSTRD